MELLFLGHSLLDFYPKTTLGTWQIHNVAKQGTIAKEGWQLITKDPEILNNCQAILVMYGINEVYYQMKEEMVIDYLNKILQEIKRRRPDLAIILSPIIQTQETTRLKPVKIASINDQINQLAKKFGTYQLNFQDFYNDQGFIQNDLTLDGIHLTPKGYRLFDQILLAILEII